MRELKLRYFIDLASNIGQRARADAQALEAAQKVMQGAITGTNTQLTKWDQLTNRATKDTALLQSAITGASSKFDQLDRAISRTGGNSGTARQVTYMRQLAAAADDADRKVSRLRDRLSKGWQAGAIGVAGAVGAYQALKDPTRDALSYDRRLANMANTAYADRGRDGRIAGMRTLEAAINAARKLSGGTREQAAEALDTMIASGVISNEDAMLMLPGIAKASVASGATATELATIGIRAQQSFKIPAKDVPSLLSSAMAAGQAGGFELKDMAKWLPQQMAMARNLGISGSEGFAKLAAWNQASVITAGTKDEAGNNLRDLLNELNTPHFRDFMAKQVLNGGKNIGKGEKLAKQKEIDDIFLDYQSRGVDKVSATIDLLDKQLAKNPRYAALQGKLDALPKDDQAGRREVLEAMAAQVQGTDVGKVFHNQQSLMAYLALSNNRAYTDDVLKKVRAEQSTPAGQSAVSVAHDVVSSTADFKVEQAKEDAKVAEKASMDKATPGIGWAAEMFSKVVSANPATAGLGLLGGAAALGAAKGAGLSALVLSLLGRGSAAGAVAGGAAEAGAAGGAATAAAAASGASRLGLFARGLSAMNPLMLIEMLTGPSEEDIAKLRAMDAMKAGYRGKGYDDPRRVDRAVPAAGGGPFAAPLITPQLDMLTLTAPNAAPSSVKAGQTAEVKVGEGRLGINITVRNETVSVVPTIEQQPSLVKLDVGRTNPGSN